MTDDMAADADGDSLKAHLREETAPMSWPDLAPFFARGQLIAVAPTLDLLDVAVAMSQDRRSDVERWLTAGDVRRVDDELAMHWHQQQPHLMTVVIAPWVLVQVMAQAQH